jgi:hypothetical protein
MIRNNIYIAAILVVALFSAAPVYASSLTSAQVSSVVSLLESFGVDQQTVSNVEAALGSDQVISSMPCNCPMIPAGSTGSCECSGTTPPPACSNEFSYNLGVGTTGSEVTALQQSLGVDPTGYYGTLTKAAVTSWQSTHGIAATGYVGPLTRTALTTWCGGQGGTTISQSTNFTATPTSGGAPLTTVFSANGLNTGAYIIDYGDGSNSGSLQTSSCTTTSGCTINTNHTYPYIGTYVAKLSPYVACIYATPIHCDIATKILASETITVTSSQINTNTPSIMSLSPTQGVATSLAQGGTQVTMTGSGFTPTGNTILFGSLVAASNVSANSSGTQLTFVVPESLAPNCSPNEACPQFLVVLSPNTYMVSVQNANGTSNTTPFTVTGTN